MKQLVKHTPLIFLQVFHKIEHIYEDFLKMSSQSLTKVAVLPVIRSGFYEDRQKFTLCRSECPTQCPTQFFSNTK